MPSHLLVILYIAVGIIAYYTYIFGIINFETDATDTLAFKFWLMIFNLVMFILCVLFWPIALLLAFLFWL